MASSTPVPLEHFSVRGAHRVSPPSAGISAILPGCAPSGKRHAEARGHRAHRQGTSALIGSVRCPERVRTPPRTNQTEPLLRADNPEPAPAELRFPVLPGLMVGSGGCFGVRAVGVRGCRPPSGGDVAGGLPEGRAAAPAPWDGPAGHPSSFTHLWLPAGACFPCEGGSEVFLWLLQWAAFQQSAEFLPCLLQIQ